MASQQNVKKGRHYCDVVNMTTLVESLSGPQKQYVADMGFKSMVMMKPYKSGLPDTLTWWLVSKVDPKEGTLKLGDKEICIESSVQKLLGVPNGAFEVIIRETGDTGLYKLYSDTKLKGKGLRAVDVSKMLKEQKDKKMFCISFMLLVFCYYLAPSATYRIDRKLLISLEDVKKIGQFNWCKYVAQTLICGVRKFQETKPMYLPGCVHLLHLIFYNYMHGSELTESNTPLIQSVAEQDLEALQPLEEEEVIYAEELSGSTNADEDKIDDVTQGVCKMLKDAVEELEVRQVRQFKEAFIAKLPSLVPKLVTYISTKGGKSGNMALVVDPDVEHLYNRVMHETSKDKKAMATAVEREAILQEKVMQEEFQQKFKEKAINELVRLGFTGSEIVNAATIFAKASEQMHMMLALPETLRREYVVKMLNDEANRK